MSLTTEEKEIKCAACGQVSVQPVITGFDPDQGVPDLDMRPAEPQRSYLEHWVRECPHCGYCNASVDIPVSFTREYLESDKYKKLGGMEDTDPLASRFIKKALACIKNREYEEALLSYLYAAWVFDDKNNDLQAAECRRAAIKIYDERQALFRGNENIVLLAADILRCSGDFDRVIREYKGRFMSSLLMTEIARFETELAEMGDSSCHKADEIPGVAARS